MSDSSHASPRTNPSSAPPQRSWANGFAADLLGVFAVFFLYAGERVPGVNEPHYWTKASHFWDPAFGAGDLFLESGNAHWLFYATLGSFTQWFSLPIAVWLGRFAIWIALALSWTWMIRSLFSLSSTASASPNSRAKPWDATALQPARFPWMATLAAGTWLAGMHWGHWAGEWVVGGAEAKGIAYASIFFAFGSFFRKRWWAGWIGLGVASAFHVVTGIWVIAASMVVSWLLMERTEDRISCWIRRHGAPLGLAACLVAIGAWPALAGDWDAPREIRAQAAEIQVYGRLGHHLAPSQFSTRRWQSFGVLLVLGGLCLTMLHRASLDGLAPEGGSDKPFSRSRAKRERKDGMRYLEKWPFGLQWAVVNALVALGIAGIGLAIDWGIGSLNRPLAASILKFYWFRWNDVALPLGIAAALIFMAAGPWEGVRRERARLDAMRGALAVLLGAGCLLIGVRFWEHSQAWGAFGDRARLLSKWDDEATQREQLRDWLAVCAWIRENTPADGLWLTPKNQQSFKWHAQRAELASNKDMPQDAVSVLEWSARLEAAYPVTEEKISIPWTDEKLWELQQRYGMRFVLLDHRVPGQGPPLLPILYPPPGVRNENFSVYEFPSSPVRLSPPRER